MIQREQLHQTKPLTPPSRFPLRWTLTSSPTASLCWLWRVMAAGKENGSVPSGLSVRHISSMGENTGEKEASSSGWCYLHCVCSLLARCSVSCSHLWSETSISNKLLWKRWSCHSLERTRSMVRRVLIHSCCLSLKSFPWLRRASASNTNSHNSWWTAAILVQGSLLMHAEAGVPSNIKIVWISNQFSNSLVCYRRDEINLWYRFN